jgi:spermidine synthase
MKLALGTIGFTSIIAQVVLIRELLAVFYGNELSLGLILAAWLFWVALGSWALGRLSERLQLGAGSYMLALALIALLLPSLMALTRALRLVLDITPGLMIGFGSMAWAIFIILAPLCLILGFQFNLGSRLLAQHGGTVGHAYVFEGIGAAIGGTLFSFLLIRFLNPFQIALGLGTINLAVGLWAFGRRGEGKKSQLVPIWPQGALLVCTVLLAILALPLGSRLNQATLDWQWGQILFSQDSIYGRLTITGQNGQRVFFENGLLMFETQGTFPEEVAHFPLLEHPNPRSVLLIGGGASGSLREILKHPVDKVHYVELDPLIIQAAQAYLPPDDRAAFNDPRVTIAYMDGRLYVKESDRRFDVVIVDLPEPSTGQLNRFYTQDFFHEVQRILSEDGIFSLGLPSAENYLSPELRHRNGGVYHTLLSIFPSVTILPGDHNFFLASEEPLSTDHLLLAQRLAEREVETRWVNASYLEYIFTTDRFTLTTSSLRDISPIRLNRDLQPICYYYDMVLWLTRFYSNLRGLFYTASLLNLWWLPVPLLIIVVMVWRFRSYAVPTVIGLTGFVEMTTQIVVLLAFQALRGHVYHGVALITAAFMVGIALGGATMNRLLSRGLEQVRIGHRGIFVSLQGAIFIYALSLPSLLIAANALPLPDLLFPFLALLAGFLGGMEFPLAVHLTKGSVGRVAGLIYGTDLVGACFGALLASVLLIPILGIPQTCYALAMSALVGLILLLLY